jgi:N-acyl-D-aspartate/D-glutamate deacylase
MDGKFLVLIAAKMDITAKIVSQHQFDFEQIEMKRDFHEPDWAPGGMEYVLVNGKVTYKDKTHTGVKAGKVLRKTT